MNDLAIKNVMFLNENDQLEFGNIYIKDGLISGIQTDTNWNTEFVAKKVTLIAKEDRNDHRGNLTIKVEIQSIDIAIDEHDLIEFFRKKIGGSHKYICDGVDSHISVRISTQEFAFDRSITKK